MSPVGPTSHSSYLDVLVVFPEVQKTMVGLNGFGKFSNVDGHDDEVLPDLPLLKVTPERLLQRPKGLLSANKTGGNQRRGKARRGKTFLLSSLLFQTNVGGGQVAPRLCILRGSGRVSRGRRDIDPIDGLIGSSLLPLTSGSRVTQRRKALAAPS